MSLVVMSLFFKYLINEAPSLLGEALGCKCTFDPNVFNQGAIQFTFTDSSGKSGTYTEPKIAACQAWNLDQATWEAGIVGTVREIFRGAA